MWRVLAFLGGIPSVMGVEDVCCPGDCQAWLPTGVVGKDPQAIQCSVSHLRNLCGFHVAGGVKTEESCEPSLLVPPALPCFFFVLDYLRTTGPHVLLLCQRRLPSVHEGRGQQWHEPLLGLLPGTLLCPTGGLAGNLGLLPQASTQVHGASLWPWQSWQSGSAWLTPPVLLPDA